MKAGGGHAKGASFERFVCKTLSLWISGGERDDVFWRTAMSGGRATIGLRRGVVRGKQAADVSAIDSLGERLLDLMLIECKHYADLNIANGLLGGVGNLRGFWNELEGKSRTYAKRSLLIARQNGSPTFCLIDESVLPVFQLQPQEALAHLPPWGCAVYLFDTFLSSAHVPEPGLKLPRRRHSL